MSNSLLTPTVIAKEALMQLENNLVMGKLVHTQYKKEFVKIGNTVTIRRPVKFSAVDGATLQKQDVEEGSTSIVVNQRKHVGWGFNTQDLTLTIDEYSERYIKPAMITLANEVDASLCGLYSSVWNHVGTPATTPSTFAAVASALQRLDEGAVPQDSRRIVLNPAAQWAIAGSQTALAIQMSEKAYKNGLVSMLGGTEMYMDQNIKVHTTGSRAGSPLVDGGSQNVTYASSKTTNTQTLTTDEWTASKTLTVGDVFTIADVYAVNPVSKESTGSLQQFVVTEAATTNATTTSDTDLTIAPAIITSGPYQNVDAAPANDAAITVVGNASTGYPQNLVFHKNAFALVTCPLEMPDGVSFKARESHNGYSVRVVKDYDIINDEEIIRLDILYGVKAIYPDLAVRLTG